MLLAAKANIIITSDVAKIGEKKYYLKANVDNALKSINCRSLGRWKKKSKPMNFEKQCVVLVSQSDKSYDVPLSNETDFILEEVKILLNYTLT